MKMNYRFLALLAAATLLFSCNKENDFEDKAIVNEDPAQEQTTPGGVVENGILMSFGADFENDAATKVAIAEGPTEATLSFDDDDRVLVRSGSVTKFYKFETNKFIPVDDGIAIDDGIEVYYPANEFDLDGENIVFKMPAAVEDLADLGAKNPLAGKIVNEGGYKVTMKAVGSILKVDVTGDRTLNSLMLSNIGPDLGEGATFTIGWDGEDKPTMATVGNSKQSMTISGLSVTLSETAKEYYFILPAGIAYDDLRVQATLATPDAGGINVFAVERGDWTPTRNQFYKMSFYAGLFSGGAGSSESPYKIANARDFKHIQTYSSSGYGSLDASHFLGAYYQQAEDIDLKNAVLTPIGNSTTATFQGTYDGNSKNLHNVNINVSGQFAAVFGYVSGDALIKDLTVSGTIQKTGSTDASVAGGIAGVLDGNAQISGCTNEATVTSTATYTGGIVGRLYSNTATVSTCHNTGAVSGHQFVGGIVGDMEGGKIFACENNANVTAANTEAGGIAARIQGGTIRACYSAGGVLISGYSRIGGIAGYQSNQGSGASLIINCAAKSNIKSTNSGNKGAAGGLVGYMYSAADKGDVILINSVALGSGIYNTKQSDSYLGAIVGQVNGEALLCYVRNCYSQHNSTTNTSASVYYSSNGTSITSTKQAYMGGIYGYLQKGTVQNCYCVGTDGANGNGINSNALVGAGTKDSTNGLAGNTRMVSNAVKNGTATVNPSKWTIAFSGLKPTGTTSAYLVDIMNLGTWTDSDQNVRQSYTSSEGSSESVCEWVGLNGTAPSSYDPAYPKELKDLGTSYHP